MRHDHEFITIGELGQLYDPFNVVATAEELGQKTVNIVQDLLGNSPPVNAAAGGQSAQGVTGPHRAQVITSQDPLNLRDGPGTGYRIAGQLARGAIVTYTATTSGPGSSSGWAFVVDQNSNPLGWAAMDYLKNVDPATPPTVPPTVDAHAGGVVSAGAKAAPAEDNTLLYAAGAGVLAGFAYLVLRKKKHQ